MTEMKYLNYLKCTKEFRDKFIGVIIKPGPVAQLFEPGEEAKYKRALKKKLKERQKLEGILL